MADPDATDKNFRTRYKEAEGWFDDVVAAILSSPFTLALFIAWTLAMLTFGFWLAK